MVAALPGLPRPSLPGLAGAAGGVEDRGADYIVSQQAALGSASLREIKGD